MRLFLVIVALLIPLLLFNQAYPEVLRNEDTRMRVLYLVLLLCLILGAGQRGRLRGVPLRRKVRDGMIWFGLLLLLVLGYSFRGELEGSRLMAELMPSRVRENGDGTLSIRASEGGHFFVRGEVNGASVRFLIDTGASGIVLTPEDARRAGIDPVPLDYSRYYSTANGVGRGADVTLGSLGIGTISLARVPASVDKSPMDYSLLGMSFLHRLKGFRVEGDTLVLVP